jgi:hypothetical protein
LEIKREIALWTILGVEAVNLFSLWAAFSSGVLWPSSFMVIEMDIQ